MKKAIASLASILILTVGSVSHGEAQGIEDDDGDGLNNMVEDRNGNTVLDSDETDPLKADTDGGGESDGTEIKAGRNPRDPNDDLTADSDGDGLVNGREIAIGTDPHKADSDGDGVDDAHDFFPLEKEFKLDADRDGIADEWEALHGLSTTKKDDPQTDEDQDGLSNQEEFINNTNPFSADTDRDGTPDSVEVETGTDPELSSCLTLGAPIILTDMERHWARDSVAFLTKAHAFGQPIVRGYASGAVAVFRPDQPVTRFEVLKIALLSACVSLSGSGSTPFSDVSPLLPDANFRRQVIGVAASFKIVQGYSDGTFRPDAPVTRAEALKMLLLASRMELPTPTNQGNTSDFPDVEQSDWFMPFVRSAKALGIVRGYSDGTFRPQARISRAEVAKIAYEIMLQNPFINGDSLTEHVQQGI